MVTFLWCNVLSTNRFAWFQNDADYSMLVAVPCGGNHVEILTQTQNLRRGFIEYLQQKQAAGIVNVPAPGSTTVSSCNFGLVFVALAIGDSGLLMLMLVLSSIFLQPAYVVHVFPPCEFTQIKLQMLAPDLLHSISDMAHLLIVIATV